MPAGVTYLSLANRTFYEVQMDWDDKCGGGIYWARNKLEGNGYKSSITNIQQMFLGAWLSILTNNPTYNQIGARIYSWLRESGLISSAFEVFDGVRTENTCLYVISEYSYKAGMLLGALSWMYRGTLQYSYLEDASQVFQTIKTNFVSRGVIKDPCEPKCFLNQVSPKGILARGLGYYYEHASENDKSQTKQLLADSVRAMMTVCDDDWNCGNNWASGQLPAQKSVHDQMNALELMIAYYKTLGVQPKSRLKSPTDGTGVSRGNGGVPSDFPTASSGKRGMPSIFILFWFFVLFLYIINLV